MAYVIATVENTAIAIPSELVYNVVRKDIVIFSTGGKFARIKSQITPHTVESVKLKTTPDRLYHTIRTTF
jgi:hypothetical protein